MAPGSIRNCSTRNRPLERERTGETGPGSAEHLARVTESLDRFPYLIDRIELAKDTLRSEGFYDMEAYRDSLFLIDKWLEVLSTIYFPDPDDGGRQSIQHVFHLLVEGLDEGHPRRTAESIH